MDNNETMNRTKDMQENGQKLTMEVHDKNEEDTKINYRGWKAMPFIIGNETFEKLGAIGTLANLLIYLTTVFNMKTITATTIITVFNGTANLGTMIGAFLCDTFFGRYKTLGFATATSFLGLLVIDLTAVIHNLHPAKCAKESVTCSEPTAGQMAVLFLGFGLMIIGAGGVRPCNLAFGADQFNPNTESGRKGVNSFFNWYVFTFTFAQMVSLTLIVYIQANVSWAIGLAIPAALMFISCVLYFSGSKIYVKVKATGSPMASVAQVIVVSIKKRKLKPVDQPWLSLFNYIPPNSINARVSHTDQFRFLDKAAIKTPEDKINLDGSPVDPWKLCSMQQVEEVKCVMRVLPIWVSAVIFYMAIVQQNTYAVFQAVQSDRRLGSSNFQIPAASYTVFLMITLSLVLPIYDRIFVPFVRRITGKEGGITLLQRIGTGIVFSILTMIVSGLVEKQRRTIALTKPTLGIAPRRGAISSMSSLWLIPQLALAGLAGAFGEVGQLEFYYKQFPENMRSIGGSLFFCGMAGASYLSSLLITIVHQTTEGASTGNWLAEDLNKAKLDYYYFLVAGLGVINFGYFLICAKWYKYKGGQAASIEMAKETNQSEKVLA